MGRTNGTYRMRLEQFEEDWQPFRQALRRRHQEQFDDLFEMADQFAAASGTQHPVHIYRAVFVSIVLAQEIERQQLEERTSELEHRVAAIEEMIGDAV